MSDKLKIGDIVTLPFSREEEPKWEFLAWRLPEEIAWRAVLACAPSAILGNDPTATAQALYALKNYSGWVNNKGVVTAVGEKGCILVDAKVGGRYVLLRKSVM